MYVLRRDSKASKVSANACGATDHRISTASALLTAGQKQRMAALPSADTIY